MARRSAVAAPPSAAQLRRSSAVTTKQVVHQAIAALMTSCWMCKAARMRSPNANWTRPRAHIHVHLLPRRAIMPKPVAPAGGTAPCLPLHVLRTSATLTAPAAGRGGDVFAPYIQRAHLSPLQAMHSAMSMCQPGAASCALGVDRAHFQVARRQSVYWPPHGRSSAAEASDNSCAC